MINIIYILTFVLCIVSGILACGIIKIFHIDISKKFKDAAITLILSSTITSVIAMIIEFNINKFTVSDGNGIIIAALFVEIFEMLFLITWFAKGKLTKLFKKVFFIAVALAICEVFVFNLKSFTSVPQAIPFSLDKVNILGDSAEFDGEKIIINADTTLSVEENLPSWTHGIIIEESQPDEANTSPFQVSAAIKDDNHKLRFEVVQDKLSMGNSDQPLTLTVSPYKELHTLELRYYRVSKPIEINSIAFCNALPFYFSWVRFLILFVIFTAIAVIHNFHLEKVTYNSGKISHRLIVQIMTLLCTLSSFLFLYTGELMDDYNPNVFNSADPYAMTVDSFIKDLPYLAEDPDPALAELENVYDRSIREDSGIFYHWDLAYFEGHYYSYFGLAPVIAFYYPFYLISGKIPKIDLAVFFFGALAIMFFCQLIIKLVDHFVKKANLLLLLILIPVTLSCTGIYYAINLPSKYTLPVISGLCFLFLCLWLGICACTSKNKKLRLGLFFLSGAALAYCVASRPSLAIGALIIAPFYIEVLADKNYSVKYRAAQASVFLIPVFAGVAMILLYNKLRFGSLFDFGQTYQLTVSDVNANKISLAGFFPMLYHYFLQLPRPSSLFPFFETNFCVLYNYSKYTYLEGCLGAFSYPFIVAGTLAMPCVCRRKNDRKSIYLTRKYFVILCFLLALFIGWQDFCMGGAITRYIVDILPLLTIGSSIALMYYTRSENNSSSKMKLIILAMAVTFAISWLITISTTDGKIMNRCSHLYESLEDIIIFWQ